MPPYKNVSHFRMGQTMNELAFNDCTRTDPGPDRHVQAAVQSCCSPPCCFPQGSCIHIGVKTNRDVKVPLQMLQDPVTAPMRLWSSCYGTISRALRVHIDRAKGSDSNHLYLFRCKEIHRIAERSLRCRCWDRDAVKDFAICPFVFCIVEEDRYVADPKWLENRLRI